MTPQQGVVIPAEQLVFLALTPEHLNRSLERSRRFAEAAMWRGPAGLGFPERLGSHEIRPWGGTADGMMLLRHSGEPVGSPTLRACARWLYRHQSEEGAWDSRGVPLADATAMVLVALNETGRPRRQAVADAWRFMDSCQVGGGFAPSSEREARVYTTCLALWAQRVHQRDAGQALDWLLGVSAAGGTAWSDVDAGPPSVAHTSWALWALALHGYDAAHPRVRAAVEWLRVEAAADLSTVIELHRAGARDIEIRTLHFTPALAALALISQGVALVDQPVQHALDLVLERQDHATGGFRVGPPGDELFVWAAARAAHAVRVALDAVAEGSTAAAISSDVRALQERADALESEVRDGRRARVRLRWEAVAAAALAVVVVRTEADLAVGRGVDAVWDFAWRVVREEGWYALWYSLGLSAVLAVGGLLLRGRLVSLRSRAAALWRRIRPW